MDPRPVYKMLHAPRLRCGINEGWFWASAAVALLAGYLAHSLLAAVGMFAVGYGSGWLVRHDPATVPILLRALRVPRRYDASPGADTTVRILRDEGR